MTLFTKRYLNRLFLILSIMVLAPTGILFAGTQATFYVDPARGNDINNGTSPVRAFRTIEKARDVVRTINSNMTGDIYVYLRGGTYTLASTLCFGSEDSGTNGFNIIYAAYKYEKPVISGGKKITNWSLYDTSRNIYRAYVGKNIETRQLFVNDIREIRARSTEVPSSLKFFKAFGYKSKGQVFANSTIPMQQWKNPRDIEFVYRNEWTAPRICVEGISRDDSTTTIIMKQPGWSFVTNKGGTSVGGNFNKDGRPWYIENAYELLDSSGEWYLDRSTHFLYYKPRIGENLARASVVVPILEELLSVRGADSANKVGFIQFKGITFSYVTFLRPNGDRGLPDAQNNVIRDDRGESIISAAVSLEYAHSIKFERDVFEHLGGTGLNMYSGCQDNLIVGTVFTDISGNGVQVGDYAGIFTHGSQNYAMSTDSLLWLRNNDITNCFFNRTGVEYYSASAIAATLPQDMDITHNEICNLPYTGIHIGWGWDRFPKTIHQRTNIQFNYVHDVMNVLRDGGAIYTVGPTNGSVSNKGYISNNYIQNVTNPFGALYLDEGSSWFDLNDNVVNNAPKYFHIWTNSIHDINVNNTYTNTAICKNAGINTTATNTTVINDNNWPANARTIMKNAGLEREYMNIKSLSDEVPVVVTQRKRPG